MRIVMVTNNYTPYTGGVVSSINAQVKALRNQGHHVFIITLDFLGKKHNDPLWVKRVYAPIKFIYKKNHMAITWRAKKQMHNLLHQLEPDLVHVHHPFFLGVIAAKCANKMGIPVIFTYHTMYEAYTHYIPLPQSIVKPMVKLLVQRFCRRVHGIIAPSRSIKDYILKEKIHQNVAVVPSGLQDMFLATKVPERPINRQKLKLLVVSRMVKEKNIEAILHVAKKLVDADVPFSLKLIGYGNAYADLQNYAYEALLLPKEQVTFMHKPPKEVIVAAYASADLFLFSSQTDTQGLVLAEAMAGGTPVIAFDGAGQRDIIKQAQNGYIVADEDEMCNKIKQLYNEPDQLKQLSRDAFETAQRYHPDHLVRRMQDFYMSVVHL